MTRSTPPAPDLDWAALLRDVNVVDLDAVREMQAAHSALFHFEGPPGIREFVRMFRLLHFYAIVALSEKKYPVLNRAWDDLRWVMNHPEIDEFSVNSWLFLDLPVADDGRTLAEEFAATVAMGDEGAANFARITKSSHHRIYVDAGGTGPFQTLVDLITGEKVTVTRGTDAERGELIWTRVIEYGGMKFMLGNSRGWPPSQRNAVTAMLRDRLDEFEFTMELTGKTQVYEQFMKLAGPYWLSILYAQSDSDPLYAPEHFLSYEEGEVPEFVPPSVHQSNVKSRQRIATPHATDALASAVTAVIGPQRSMLNSPSTARTVAVTARVGRNEACPCGSGKKYKKCHGQ